MRRKKRKGSGEESLSDADEQLELLAVEPHPVEAEADTAKRCTAQLLFERYPQDYADIVNALAVPLPIRRIKKLWRVGTGTVYAIQRREGAKVGTLKAQIAQALFLGVKAGAEHFAELITDCDDVVAVSMALKAMAETANLMNGQATTITENRVVIVDATKAHARLAEIISEIDSETGEKNALRDVTPVPARAPVPVLDVTPETLTPDDKSNACDLLSADNQRSAVPCHTSRHTLPSTAPKFDRGEGGAPASPRPALSIRLTSRFL